MLSEDVGVQVNPESVFRALRPRQVPNRLAGSRTGAELADLVTVNDQHACRQWLAAPAFPISRRRWLHSRRGVLPG